MARAVLAAASPEEASSITIALYRAIWTNGETLADSDAILDVLSSECLDTSLIASKIDKPDMIAQLERNTDKRSSEALSDRLRSLLAAPCASATTGSISCVKSLPDAKLRHDLIDQAPCARHRRWTRHRSRNCPPPFRRRLPCGDDCARCRSARGIGRADTGYLRSALRRHRCSSTGLRDPECGPAQSGG